MIKSTFSSLIILILALLLMGATFKKDDKPQVFAVIVGVSTFADKSINSLKFAHADAYSYSKFLQSPFGGAVPAEHIKYIPNELATRQYVIDQIRYYANLAGPEDVLIFYISTHGVPDPKIRRNLYYTLYDTDPKNYWGTALKSSDILEQQQYSSAKIKLFFSDACHSGGSGINLGTKGTENELINSLQASRGLIKEPLFATLVASSKAESSFEDAKWGNGHGVFTYFMIKGLEGEADKKSKYANGDGNGIITLRELYNYLNNVVPTETGKLQHPEMLCDNPDIIPLAAVSPTKYIGALELVANTTSKTAESKTSLENAPIENSEFGPEVSYRLMDKNEAVKKYSESSDRIFGRCVFLNKLGEGVIMYYGRCITTMSDNIYNALTIGSNRKGVTNDLHIGWSERKGPTNPSTATYLFYFFTTDPAHPRKYGTISLNFKAGYESLIALDKENLILTVNGPRDTGQLRYTGFSVD